MASVVMAQGDTVRTVREAENLDPRGGEEWVVPEGTVARITGWRGSDGVLISWSADGRKECAVVSRSAIRVERVQSRK